MTTYKQLVYIVLDELKGISNEFTYTEDHVMFLLSKYRTFLLKQRYSDLRKQIPESNYQTICLPLEQIETIEGYTCEGGYMLRSKSKIPTLMKIGNPVVFPVDYYSGNIIMTSRERMRFVGTNPYLQNIIYASIGPDNHLYFKSSNPQFLYLENARINGIFEDCTQASELSCETNQECDIMDREFPIENALVTPLEELVVKELTPAIYKPEDSNNNANDDLADIASFIRENMKSNLSKAIEQ